MASKKTNMNMQIDSKVWKQFTGLADLLEKDKNVLLEEALKDRIKKEKR